jgi:hypothetical protein
VVDAMLKVHRDCLGDLRAFVANLSLRTDRVERPRLEPVEEKLGPNDLPRIVAGGKAGDDR